VHWINPLMINGYVKLCLRRQLYAEPIVFRNVCYLYSLTHNAIRNNNALVYFAVC
jgi:hypothetical protein